METILQKGYARKSIESNQNNTKIRGISYEIRLRECGLTTLETRRLRDQIEVFKILNGYETIETKYFFSVKQDTRTSGCEVTLAEELCRLDIRKFTFSQSTVNECNRLCAEWMLYQHLLGT